MGKCDEPHGLIAASLVVRELYVNDANLESETNPHVPVRSRTDRLL